MAAIDREGKRNKKFKWKNRNLDTDKNFPQDLNIPVLAENYTHLARSV